MKLAEFLKVSKEALQKRSHPMTVVMGNESCDLDTMVSSMGWAYLIHLMRMHRKPGTRDVTVVPVFPIPRADYALRPEVSYLFRRANVNPDHCTFLDECDPLALHDSHKLASLYLVDHNRLSHHFSMLTPLVQCVIDHHKDEAMYHNQIKLAENLMDPLNEHKYIVDLVGSCSTLVTSEFLKFIEHVNTNEGVVELDRDFALLAYGTVLMDSVCLNAEHPAKRTTPLDLTVGDALQAMLPHVQRNDLYNALMKAKECIEDMTNVDLLRRDYKEWTAGPYTYGVPAIASLSASEWLCRYPNATDLFTTLDVWMTSHHLSVFVPMFAYRECEENFFRDLVIYSPTNPQLAKQLATLLVTKTNLELVPYDTHELPEFVLPYIAHAPHIHSNTSPHSHSHAAVSTHHTPSQMPTGNAHLYVYHQKNISASRKQVQPILAELVHSLVPSDHQ
eukprot:TRINITY_DN15013_c0_g1::TRINITY_DN15013_c0_g1_i1::g.25747::m.25747 TRINITY_DN15013_c0_g1::TRINITY_DN15013_c0_g1_i1::g.25747  ORF type:complete len:447 (+),score=78.41,sp/Q8BIW1/PRUN1_MOUSE/28.44/5e-35,DHHA2/PF02833.9/9.2e-16,DHH/PF01368.15/3e-06 TRINITY_DN15013_c0_g1_i1:48-1388(+)